MSRNVGTIGTSDSCVEAVARMHRARVRHLPVVDKQDALLGIVTDRDLRHHLSAPSVFNKIGTMAVDVLLKTVPVTAVMFSPVLSVRSDDEVAETARVMIPTPFAGITVSSTFGRWGGTAPMRRAGHARHIEPLPNPAISRGPRLALVLRMLNQKETKMGDWWIYPIVGAAQTRPEQGET